MIGSVESMRFGSVALGGCSPEEAKGVKALRGSAILALFALSNLSPRLRREKDTEGSFVSAQGRRRRERTPESWRKQMAATG